MLKRYSALLLAVALSITLSAAEPKNLNDAKYEVVQYVNSGAYFKDLSDAAIKANQHIAKRLNKAKPGEKLAIVFDIDETAISNLSHIMANDFGYIPEVWNGWVTVAQAKPIVPVQIGYDMAIRANVAVFFVTARKPEQSAATEKNLRQVGYEVWTKIYYKPAGSELSSRSYKTSVRRQITNDGYTIIANIGDQDSDLAGGLAEKTFKLPNPFYRVN